MPPRRTGEYYLRRDFEGSHSQSGVPFLAADCYEGLRELSDLRAPYEKMEPCSALSCPTPTGHTGRNTPSFDLIPLLPRGIRGTGCLFIHKPIHRMPKAYSATINIRM